MLRVWSAALLLAMVACTDTEPTDEPEFEVPDTYTFTGRTGDNSVAHTGQTVRQLLIDDLARYIGGLTTRIDGGYVPAAGEVRSDMELYLSFDAEVAGDLEHDLTTDPPAAQQTYGEVGGAMLWDKLAGNDPVGQHADWSTDFVGGSPDGVTTPQSQVEAWLDELDALAVGRANGTVPTGPDGRPIGSVFVTADGRDLKQLTQKFLRVGIAFSQGADDYLDDDVDGKGLLSDHTAVEEGKTYTSLEHQWDEGFGYFGASQDYGLRAVSDIADSPWNDSDGNGSIDLATEMSFGHSLNAAKRDVGATSPTMLAERAFSALLQGRALLAATDDALTESELDTLRGHRDEALAAWEAAIGATCVHYINEVLRDMGAMDTDDYDFQLHAKHWSELKGFALGAQFNPRSPLSDADFERLHDLIGVAPVLPSAQPAQREAYAGDLIQARSLLGTAYGFDASNLGDDDGMGGW